MASNFGLLLKLIRLDKHFWVILLLLIQTASQPATTYLNGRLLSALADETQFNEFLIYSAVAIVAGLITLTISSYLISQGGSLSVADYRRRIISEITKKSAAYFESHPTAFLSHVLLNEVNVVQNACSYTLPELFKSAVLLASNCVMAALVKWYFLLVLVGQIIAITLLYFPINMKLSSLNQRKVSADKKFSAAQTELISNWRTIRVLAAEDSFEKKIGAILQEKIQREKMLNAFQNFVVPFLWLISATVAVMFSYWGRILWIQGEISIGDIYIIWQAANTSHYVIRPLLMRINELNAVYASLENIQKTVNFHQQVRHLEGSLSPSLQSWELQLKDVQFKYPSATSNAIDCLNLTIPANCMTAFVGPSGAGKSTITNLILDLVEPTEGEILLNGVNLKDISKQAFYNLVGYVPQDVSIFDGTIDENIRLGNPEATLQQVEEAAKMAFLHDYIMSLPEGLKTSVGERGLKLSGGQRQRLAIARALIRKPKLLILDEATSALDTHSEKCIQEAIEKISTYITTVVVAHRLSTVKKASMIYVFSNGNVIETGSYDTLMQAGGVFSQMVQSQQNQETTKSKYRERSETR